MISCQKGLWGAIIFVGALLLSGDAVQADDVSLPPIEDSEAYQQFVLRGPSEFSKLLYLLDRFKDTGFGVIYDGYHYDNRQSLTEARRYLARRYQKGESAQRWLTVHAYRSPGGQIIYLEFPDGKTRPLRDILLEELDALNEFQRGKK